ncbi:excitatory amino acid transporter 3 [Copidosoma floridanum]|uniref:excitatory amino acid transporter 3 n=1 Tax=Copidosoma floridanum TaxID=29053 RepID=UPI0006C94227|nr:excitatory amino acid transporter 3 [Copidosoma floridanum]
MSKQKRWKSCVSENLLMMMTVGGVLAGVVLGFALKNGKDWSKREIMYIQFPGDLFLRMLKSLILPLILSSIVSAIGSLDLSLSGRIGRRSIYYYATTTVCAVILGMILVTTIRPGLHGHGLEADASKAPKRSITTIDTLLDLVRNIFPPNLVQACIAQYRTELTPPANATNETSKYDYDISSSYGDGTNTLGLVVFGIILGITVGKMGEQGKPLLDFFNALSEAMMIITNWVIWLSPVGVTFLVAAQILDIKEFGSVVQSLGLYFLTVLLGLILHGFGTLSIIFFVCTRELPFRAIGKMSQVMVTAFGTASSSATLPITLQCMDSMGVDSRISRFVVPIGATINMDGTALYEAVAAIFIAQVRHIDLSISDLIGISITATAASIGAAGIPQAGLVTMVMVLNTVGLPDKDVTLILAVDWLLDRFRTTVNVMCDALAAIIVEKMSKGELDNADAVEGLQEATELAHLRKVDD